MRNLHYGFVETFYMSVYYVALFFLPQPYDNVHTIISITTSTIMDIYIISHVLQLRNIAVIALDIWHHPSTYL